MLDRMKKTAVSQILEVDAPILQAGMPWISNVELVAAVSNAGGLGILHPTAGMAATDDQVSNLREAMRKVHRLTDRPFGVAFYLPQPQITDLMNAAMEEGVRVAVTYGGSPSLYTGFLKDNEVKVLHQIATVRHARGAEAQGVDIVIAEGYEGGGARSTHELSNLVLVPQVVGAVSIPVIASGGIVDARGFAAMLALGAQGVQLGTRFIATHECIAHPRYKEALLAAIDTGTVIVGRYQWPTRVLRNEGALKSRQQAPATGEDAIAYWESHLGLYPQRAACLEGDVDNSVAYAGSGVGLISEIMGAGEVVRSLMEGVDAVLAAIH